MRLRSPNRLQSGGKSIQQGPRRLTTITGRAHPFKGRPREIHNEKYEQKCALSIAFFLFTRFFNQDHNTPTYVELSIALWGSLENEAAIEFFCLTESGQEDLPPYRTWKPFLSDVGHMIDLHQSGSQSRYRNWKSKKKRVLPHVRFCQVRAGVWPASWRSSSFSEVGVIFLFTLLAFRFAIYTASSSYFHQFIPTFFPPLVVPVPIHPPSVLSLCRTPRPWIRVFLSITRPCYQLFLSMNDTYPWQDGCHDDWRDC